MYGMRLGAPFLIIYEQSTHGNVGVPFLIIYEHSTRVKAFSPVFTYVTVHHMELHILFTEFKNLNPFSRYEVSKLACF